MRAEHRYPADSEKCDMTVQRVITYSDLYSKKKRKKERLWLRFLSWDTICFSVKDISLRVSFKEASGFVH